MVYEHARVLENTITGDLTSSMLFKLRNTYLEVLNLLLDADADVNDYGRFDVHQDEWCCGTEVCSDPRIAAIGTILILCRS